MNFCNIKHFITTRFYCANLGLGLNIFDENILSSGYENMKRWFIPSFNNQTDLDFTMIFLKSKQANMNGINGKLTNLSSICNFKIDVVDFESFDDYLYEHSQPEEDIIISRVDCDDTVRKDIVEDTKKNLQYSNKNISFYGYNSGYEQDISHPYILKTFDKDYGISGSWSVMQSIKLNYRKYRIHPNMWNHTNCIQTLIKMNIKEYNFKVNKKDRFFIRNYTGFNGSYLNKKYNAKTKNEQISAEEIHELFGV